jgi:hypothetical protein
MDIAVYIGDLLCQHDCVIVPGFGGFVASYAPAKIHPVTHTFHPPSKYILFNSKLTRDDGLLIDYICQSKGILYDEAKARLEDTVWKLNNSLEKGERIFLKEVGVFRLDAGERLIFEPDETANFLEDSFGLASFVSPPVNRKGYKKRYEPGFVDRRESRRVEKIISRKVLAYMVIILFLFTGGWFGIHSGLVRFGSTEHASIAKIPDPGLEKPFGESLKPEPVAATIPLKDLDFTKEIVNEDDVSLSETPEAEEIVSVPLYHIIGGAFAHEENAEKLLLALRQKGFDAQRPGLSPSGLHMVSYFATHDKNEALLNLASIRRDENQTAWLLKR